MDYKEDYNPVVEDELLSHIGELTEENLVILVTMTVPEQIEQMSVNLKAPIIVMLTQERVPRLSVTITIMR